MLIRNLLLLLSLLFACRVVVAAEHSFDSVTLWRGACEGTCPVYSVKIMSDGTVLFDLTGGKRTDHISAADLAFLSDALSRLDRSVFNDKLKEKADECRSGTVDFPDASIEVIRGSSRQTMSYNPACREVPGAVRVNWLAATIDEIARTEQWVAP